MNVFEGIDTSWNRVKGGKAIGDILYQVEKDFDFKNPSASIPRLVKAYQLIQQLENKHWKAVKTKEIQEIITAASGLYLEAVATEANTTKGSEITLKVEAINRSTNTITLQSIKIAAVNINDVSEKVLKNNIRNNFEFKGSIPSNFDFTNPYWLNNKGTLGMYNVSDQKLIGRPETDHKIKALFT